MEVKINREIRNYKEAVFWGMSTRQFLCTALACTVAVGMYFLLRTHMGTAVLSWICMAVASPFVAFGFVRVNDMNLEDFLDAWLDFAIYVPRKLNARPSEVINKNISDRRL